LAAKETAKQLGMEMTLFDGGYNPSQQLNQMQTALASGQYDAAVVQALDGTVVCKTITEDYPKANILVVDNVTPLCEYGTNQTGKSVDEVWAPGTMNFVGSNNTRAYIDGWFAAAAKANPGKQKVVAVLGPAVAAQTRVIEVALAKFSAENPEYTVDKIYSDYTTTGAFNETQTYLQGHADTTLILSMYTPDISQGIVKAAEGAGLLGKIHIVDQGFGEFSLQQIAAGNIQFSTLFFPYNGIKVSLEAIAAAQRGDAGPRFVDDSVIGTAKSPFTVTKDTITELPAELR
jgi:ribose transport system substrate-binding protein